MKSFLKYAAIGLAIFATYYIPVIREICWAIALVIVVNGFIPREPK
jgi:hypothetical protein